MEARIIIDQGRMSEQFKNLIQIVAEMWRAYVRVVYAPFACGVFFHITPSVTSLHLPPRAEIEGRAILPPVISGPIFILGGGDVQQGGGG